MTQTNQEVPKTAVPTIVPPVGTASAVPAEKVVPIDHWVEAMKSLTSVEDFAVRVAKELLNRKLIQPMPVDPKKPIWAVYQIGDGKSQYSNIDLTAVQSNDLRNALGVPMGLAFRVALLDHVPQSQAEPRRRERQIQTIQRDQNRAAATSTNVLLDELNKRRLAEGLPVIEG